MRVPSILIVCAFLLFSLVGNLREGVSILPSSSAKTVDTLHQSQRAEAPVKIAGYTSSISLDEKDRLDTAFGITSQVVQSSNGLWQDVNPKSLSNVRIRQQHGPHLYRSLKLNTDSLKTLLRRAPAESPGTNQSERIILSLPLPNGGFSRFNIQDSPIMEEQLANRYPEIKTYRGQGIDDPTSTTRFDWTQFGFHAIILSTNGTVLIEPDSVGDVTNYIAYFHNQSPEGSFQCEVDGPSQEAAARQYESLKQRGGIRPNVFSGTSLQRYRLAVAATAEYTATYGSGTVAGGLAAVTTTMNLVNAIYERDVAIRMVLIANNDAIIFTDTTTDGYTHDSVGALGSQNQTKVDSVIGSANYDIGHVFDGRTSFSFSWQGQAQIAAVCKNGLKAQGVSIARNMQPSNIYQYYSVAHEMGHQFGASHTFNASTGLCGQQRSSITAYEPGTGSTIMGYRLNCGAEDLNSTDHYFHIASLEQITAYTTVGTGGSCASPLLTGNNVPTVNAGQNYTVPKETPFALTATANDADGDPLTYCWEEFDLGPVGPPHTDDGSRPIFRSYAPETNPTRTFIRGANTGANVVPFESLPLTTRTMRFRVTVRDNRADGGAVNSSDMQLSVRAEAGPFNLSSPSSSDVWTAGSAHAVTWNVANTDNAPVSCSSVRILLSTNNGNTYPIVLANATPNDGFEMVTIPGTPSPTSRIKVEAVGNVFFNVSGGFIIGGTANAAPTISSFSPTTGPAGTVVTIEGTNFIAPSAVRFNGLNASFTVNSTTQIVATVPVGVTTGPITVVTADGTATSSASFIAPASFSVSGRVADAGNNPIPDVTITFTRNFQGTITTTTTTTDASGNFSSGDVGCQNGVLVTPSKVGFGFSPLARSFVSSNCLNGTQTADFTGTLAGPNSIQFTSNNFAVSEGVTSASLTLTRTGDTAGSATVFYETTDTDNFTVNCANIAGNAFARCDFATSLDTVTFASGETSKTLLVPIINDSWAEGNETFTVALSSPAGATLGANATATVTINDNETVDGPNPIFTTPFFVRQHYLDFLSREPEAGEPWSAILNGCSDVNNNPACDRLTVSGAFFGSPEFSLKGLFAYRFYKLAFNRLPLYSEIVVDMRAVTGATPPETFQKKANFTNNFVLRTEFVNLFNAQTNTQYVNTLMGRYSLTSIRTPDPAAPDGTNKVTLTSADLINRLNGVGGTLTRAQVLRAIADSEEVGTAEANQGFVAMQYYGYLRRTPDTPGFNSWINHLNANPTDFRTMVNGFMNSDEYRLRFGPQN